MGEQVNIEKCWISTDGGPGVVWNGIQSIEMVSDIQYTGETAKIEIPMTIEGTLDVKWPKNFRCKTRKRFIKLLMSIGCDRNTAVIFADTMAMMNEFVNFKHSYQEWWWHIMLRKLTGEGDKA